MAARNVLYMRQGGRENRWPAGQLAPIPDPAGADDEWIVMRDLFRTKWNHLRALRVQMRGTPVGVSMPVYSLEDFWERPDVLDAFILIERWKLEKKREEERKLFNLK